MKQVAVVGGTGLLGRKVVQALHSQGELFKITVISRKSPPEPVLSGVTYIAIDNYTDSDNSLLILALRGHDILVSMLGGPVAPAGPTPFLL